jgi:glutamate---cysteine ligase / carboxylate-amine ligase
VPPPAEDDYLVYSYNRFQACRFGLDGTIVPPSTLEAVSLREDILATLRQVQPHADAASAQPALDLIYRIAHEGSDASHLRAAYAGRGSMEAVVDAALERFRLGETALAV